MNDELQRLHFEAFMAETQRQGFTWHGVPILKTGPDLLMLAEAIFETQPQVIVETGTWKGGAALFYRDILLLAVPDGLVVTMDDPSNEPIRHPGVTYIRKRSLDAVEDVAALVDGRRTMVCLDSDHSASYVRKELEAYHRFVSVGCYLVVEDTIQHGMQAPYDQEGGGPIVAAREFVAEHPEFEVDRNKERYGVTFYPEGWLRRLR